MIKGTYDEMIDGLTNFIVVFAGSINLLVLARIWGL